MSLRSSPDISRLAAAVQRPGIDPRLWLTLATVVDVAIDTGNGVYADVQFLPDQTIETCLVGSGYAGDGFGAWAPLEVNDIVLVAVPSGDPTAGPIIISRLWMGTDPPPPEINAGNDNTTANPTIVVKAGQTLKIICRTGATVEVTSDIPATDSVALATPNDENWDDLAKVFADWIPAGGDGGAALKTLLTTLLATWPQPTASVILKGE